MTGLGLGVGVAAWVSVPIGFGVCVGVVAGFGDGGCVGVTVPIGLGVCVGVSAGVGSSVPIGLGVCVGISAGVGSSGWIGAGPDVLAAGGDGLAAFEVLGFCFGIVIEVLLMTSQAQMLGSELLSGVHELKQHGPMAGLETAALGRPEARVGELEVGDGSERISHPIESCFQPGGQRPHR